MAIALLVACGSYDETSGSGTGAEPETDRPADTDPTGPTNPPTTETGDGGTIEPGTLPGTDPPGSEPTPTTTDDPTGSFCFGCIDSIPREGVIAQLDYPGPTVIGELDSCEFFPASGALSVGLTTARAEVGSHQWFCVERSIDAPVSVTVEFPSGERRAFSWDTARNDRVLSLDAIGSQPVGRSSGDLILLVPPDAQLGTYLIEAEFEAPSRPADDPDMPPDSPAPGSPPAEAQNAPATLVPGAGDVEYATTTVVPATTAAPTTTEPPSTPAPTSPPVPTDRSVTSFEVVRATSPSVQTMSQPSWAPGLDAPGAVLPGATVSFLLSGFAPDATVEPMLYVSLGDGSCDAAYCYVGTLQPVQVNGRGAAVYHLETPPDAPVGNYYLTAGRSSSSVDASGFNGEFRIG